MKKNYKKRSLSLIIAVVMVMVLIPAVTIPVSAEAPSFINAEYIILDHKLPSNTASAILGIKFTCIAGSEDITPENFGSSFYSKHYDCEIPSHPHHLDKVNTCVKTFEPHNFTHIERIDTNQNTIFYAWFRNPLTCPENDPSSFILYGFETYNQGETSFYFTGAPYIVFYPTVGNLEVYSKINITNGSNLKIIGGISEFDQRRIDCAKAIDPYTNRIGARIGLAEDGEGDRILITGGTEANPAVGSISMGISYWKDNSSFKDMIIDFRAHVRAVSESSYGGSVISLQNFAGTFIFSGSLDIPEYTGSTYGIGISISTYEETFGFGEFIIKGKLTTSSPNVELLSIRGISGTSATIKQGAVISRTLANPDTSAIISKGIISPGWNASLKIEGGTITDNVSHNHINGNGTISMDWAGRSIVEITGGIIHSENAIAISMGGYDHSQLIISGGTITNNKWHHPVIYMGSGNSLIHMTGGTIKNNDNIAGAPAILMDYAEGIVILEGGKVANGTENSWNPQYQWSSDPIPVIYGHANSKDYKHSSGYVIYREGVLKGRVTYDPAYDSGMYSYWPPVELDGIYKLPAAPVKVIKNGTVNMPVAVEGGEWPAEGKISFVPDPAGLLTNIGVFSNGSIPLTAGATAGKGTLNATLTYAALCYDEELNEMVPRDEDVTFKFAELNITDKYIGDLAWLSFLGEPDYGYSKVPGEWYMYGIHGLSTVFYGDCGNMLDQDDFKNFKLLKKPLGGGGSVEVPVTIDYCNNWSYTGYDYETQKDQLYTVYCMFLSETVTAPGEYTWELEYDGEIYTAYHNFIDEYPAASEGIPAANYLNYGFTKTGGKIDGIYFRFSGTYSYSTAEAHRLFADFKNIVTYKNGKKITDTFAPKSIEYVSSTVSGQPVTDVVIKFEDYHMYNYGDNAAVYTATFDYKGIPAGQTVKPGDLDGNGEVEPFDLVRLSRHIAEIERITDPYLLKAADVTGDGRVTIADLIRLARWIAGIDKSDMG